MPGLHQRRQADKKAQGLLDGRGFDTQRLPGAPLAGKRLRFIPQPRSQHHANRHGLSPWCWDMGPDEGARVKAQLMSRDPDTLSPLQGALGYDIAQNIFVGPDNLVVEGLSDYTYLTVI